MSARSWKKSRQPTIASHLGSNRPSSSSQSLCMPSAFTSHFYPHEQFFSTSPRLDTREIDSSENDSSSISSLETIDNNPGTGRTLDTHVFQPLGKRLEYMLGRIRLQYLGPENIADKILDFWGDGTSPTEFLGLFVSSHDVEHAISGIAKKQSGKSVYAGCRKLIALTQSRCLPTRFMAVVKILTLTVTYREVTQLFQAIETLRHLLSFDTLIPPNAPEDVAGPLRVLCILGERFLLQGDVDVSSLNLAHRIQCELQELVEELEVEGSDILKIISECLRLFLRCSHCICHPRSSTATINLPFLDILETTHLIAAFLFRCLRVLKHSSQLAINKHHISLSLLDLCIKLFDHLAACIMAELHHQFGCRAFGPKFTNASLRLITLFMSEERGSSSVFPLSRASAATAFTRIMRVGPLRLPRRYRSGANEQFLALATEVVHHNHRLIRSAVHDFIGTIQHNMSLQEARHACGHREKILLFGTCAGASGCPFGLPAMADEAEGDAGSRPRYGSSDLLNDTTRLARNIWGKHLCSDMAWSDVDSWNLQELFELQPQIVARLIEYEGKPVLIIPMPSGTIPDRGYVSFYEMAETSFYVTKN